jgi:hypothetical protein
MQADAYLAQRVGGQTDIRKVTAANLGRNRIFRFVIPRCPFGNRDVYMPNGQWCMF